MVFVLKSTTFVLLNDVSMFLNNKKWVYLIILSLIWGTSFILIKKALLGLNPYQLGALRTIITGLFLFAAGYNSIKTIKKEDWKWIVIYLFLQKI